MIQQQTIDGIWEGTEELTKEANRLCEKFPAAVSNPGLFGTLAFKDRYPWFSQLDQQRQHDIKEFARDIMTLQRRRQEFRENIPQ